MATAGCQELPCAPNARACAAAGYTFLLLATELRREGSGGFPIMLIQKPNNTMNQTMTLHQLREGHYVKVSTQPPAPAWHESLMFCPGSCCLATGGISAPVA